MVINPLDTSFVRGQERVSGYRLAIKRSPGDHGPLLLLVHGIGVSSEYFHPLMNQLARRGANVVALDLPGYGEAETPPQELSVGELADIVNEFVKQQGVQECVLVGHSMGTQIVTEAAIRWPQPYTKLILMSPTINKHERTLVQQALRLLQDMLREPPRNNLVVMKGYIRMGMVRYLKTSESMFSDALEKDVAKVTVPLLLLTGERDPIATREWARLLQEAARHDRHVEIAGGAHNFQFSHPKETAEACLDFLRA